MQSTGLLLNATKQFQIIHDVGKIKCVIGQSSLARDITPLIESAENCSIEYALAQSQAWFDQRQFIVLTSDVFIKEQAIQQLKHRSPHYFSLINRHNIFGSKTVIGVGTYINAFNDLACNVSVGDHCVITTHCQISHKTVIGDYSHLSSYSYINNITLGKGVVVGLRNSIFGAGKTIPDYCNFISGGTVTKDITQSGTYFGNKKLSTETSQTHRIL